MRSTLPRDSIDRIPQQGSFHSIFVEKDWTCLLDCQWSRARVGSRSIRISAPFPAQPNPHPENKTRETPETPETFARSNHTTVSHHHRHQQPMTSSRSNHRRRRSLGILPPSSARNDHCVPSLGEPEWIRRQYRFCDIITHTYTVVYCMCVMIVMLKIRHTHSDRQRRRAPRFHSAFVAPIHRVSCPIINPSCSINSTTRIRPDATLSYLPSHHVRSPFLDHFLVGSASIVPACVSETNFLVWRRFLRDAFSQRFSFHPSPPPIKVARFLPRKEWYQQWRSLAEWSGFLRPLITSHHVRECGLCHLVAVPLQPSYVMCLLICLSPLVLAFPLWYVDCNSTHCNVWSRSCQRSL